MIPEITIKFIYQGVPGAPISEDDKQALYVLTCEYLGLMAYTYNSQSVHLNPVYRAILEQSFKQVKKEFIKHFDKALLIKVAQAITKQVCKIIPEYDVIIDRMIEGIDPEIEDD